MITGIPSFTTAHNFRVVTKKHEKTIHPVGPFPSAEKAVLGALPATDAQEDF